MSLSNALIQADVAWGGKNMETQSSQRFFLDCCTKKPNNKLGVCVPRLALR